MPGIGDSWGTREELLHPRDSHGRFRSKWKMSESVLNAVLKITQSFSPRTFTSDGQATQYTQNLAHSKPGRFHGGRGYARLQADFENANNDLLDGVPDEPSTKKFVEMMDGSMIDAPDSFIASMVVGPDAFGLTPDTLPSLEELTGNVMANRGYTAVNLGTPLGGGQGQITMSIAVPKGTKIAVPGRSPTDRAIYMNRDQELTITKVKPDGRGGYYVWAVATPATPGENPGPIGGHAGAGHSGNREADVKALEDARMKRDMGQQGASQLPGGVAAGGLPEDPNTGRVIAPVPGETEADKAARERATRRAQVLGRPAAPAQGGQAPAPGTGAQAPAPAAPSVPAQRPSPDATPPAPTPAAPTPAPAAPTPAPAAPTPAPTPALPPGGAPPVTPQAPAAPSPAAPAADVPAGATAVVTGTPATSFREALHSADIPAPSKMHRQSFNDAINGITSGKRQPADVLRDLDSDIEHAQKAQSLPAAEQGNVDTDIERMSKLAELIRSHFSLGAPKHTKTRLEVRSAIKSAEAARSKKMARPGGGSDRAPGEAPGTQMMKALQNARGGTPRKEAPKPKTTQQERGQKLLDIHAQNQLDDKLNAEQRQRWADAAGGEPAGMKGSAGDILLDETADLLRNGRVTRAKAVERLREHARNDQTPEAQYLHKVADQIEADTSKAAKRVPLKKTVKKVVDTATAEKSLEGRTPRNILTGLNGLDVGNMRALAESWGIDTRGGDKKLKLKAALAKELAQHWKDHPELQKGTPPAPVKKVAKAATKAAAPSVPDTSAPAVPAKKARASAGTKLTAQERTQDRANAKKLAAAPTPAPAKAAKATKAAQLATTYDEKRAAEQKAWDDAANGVKAGWQDAVGAPPAGIDPVQQTGLHLIAGDVASKKLSRPKAAARLRDVADNGTSGSPETKAYLRKLADHLSTPAPRKKAVRTALPAPEVSPAKAAAQVANAPEVPAVVKKAATKAAASAADRASAGTAAGKITASRLMREDRILVTTNPAGEHVPAKLKRGANPLTVTSVHYGERGRRTIKGHFGDGKEVTLKDVAPGQTFHAAETAPAAPALAAPTPAVPTPAVPTPAAPKKVAKRLTGGAITDATPEDLVTAHAEGRISGPMARKELQRRADDLRQAANFQDSATGLPTSQGNKDRATGWRAEADKLEAQAAGIKSTRAKKEVQADLTPAAPAAADPLTKVAEAVPSMPDTAPAIAEKVKATKGPAGVSTEDRVAVHLMARIRAKNPAVADEIMAAMPEKERLHVQQVAELISQEAKRVKSGGPSMDHVLSDIGLPKPDSSTLESHDHNVLKSLLDAGKVDGPQGAKASIRRRLSDSASSVRASEKEMKSPHATTAVKEAARQNIDRQEQRQLWLRVLEGGLNGDGGGDGSGGSAEVFIDGKSVKKVALPPALAKTLRDASPEDLRKAAELQGIKLPESATTKDQIATEVLRDMARRRLAGQDISPKVPTPAPAKPEPTLPKVTRDIKGDTVEGHSYRDTLKKLESGDLTPAAGAKVMRDGAKHYRAQAKAAGDNGHASPEARAALRDRHLDVARQYDAAAVEFGARKKVAKQADVQAVLADVAAKATAPAAAPEAPARQPVTPLDLIHMSADDIVQAHADGRLTGKRAGGALRRKADNRATQAAFIGLGDKNARAARPEAAMADAEVARIRALADQVEARPGMVRPKKAANVAPAQTKAQQLSEATSVQDGQAILDMGRAKAPYQALADELGVEHTKTATVAQLKDLILRHAVTRRLEHGAYQQRTSGITSTEAPSVGATLARATKSAPAAAPAKKATKAAQKAAADQQTMNQNMAVLTRGGHRDTPTATAPTPAAAPAPAKKAAPVAAKVETLTDVKQATKKVAAKKATASAPGHYTQAQLMAMEPSELRAIEDQLGLGRPSLARDDRAAAILAKQAESAPVKKAAKKAAPAGAPAVPGTPAAPAKAAAKTSGPPVARRNIKYSQDRSKGLEPPVRSKADVPLKMPNGGSDQGNIHMDSDIGQLWQDLANDDREPNSFVNEIAHMGDEMGRHRMSLQQVLDRLRQMEGQASDSAVAARIKQTVDHLSAPPAGKLDLPADMPEKLRAAFHQFADIPTARMTASKDAHKRVGNETITPVSPLDKKLAAIKQLLAGDGSAFDIERALMNRDYHESADAATTMWSIMEKAVSDKAVQAWIRNTMRAARQKKGA